VWYYLYLQRDRTQRTLQRDLSALEQDHLLLRHPEGYAPNIDILRSMVSVQK
jgi:DeoR/GlpR family transcriptional regulator of sugar metabolism